MYGEELDSFVVNLDEREVYWIDEDTRHPVTELTEGRIGFAGTRSELRTGEAAVLRNVEISFSINRVTGELTLDGILNPEGYDNRCAVKDKIL